MKYRPWGPVDWALSLSGQKQWYFVGAIGTEERSLCSWRLMRGLGVLCGELLVQIDDEDSEKYRDQGLAALKVRHDEFAQNGGRPSAVRSMELMTELFKIQELSRDAMASGSSVALDITSLPKRFFFPLLKTLINSDQVRNLLVTYSSPATYADGALYEDIDTWKNLPGFGGNSTGRENLIVSIGFLVESLRDYFASNPDHGQVKILVPFPASLAALRRTWESVANLERGYENGRFEKHRIETCDMSAAFDRIVMLDSHSQKTAAFAPFGPKPISAAMCLYAIQRNSAVYYPQPTIYHPGYTQGIQNNDPASAVSAYWIKHEGENLYAL